MLKFLILLLLNVVIEFATGFQTANGLFGFLFGFRRICLCRCGLASRSVRGARLLGGEGAAPNEFPWLALVQAPGSDGAGGALLTDTHVITAATVVHGLTASSVTVTLGAHERCADGSGLVALNSSVSSVLIHPRYSHHNKDNDIALLRLAHLVPFSQFISPICLPPPGSTDEGQVAAIATWSERAVADGPLTWSCTPRVATMPILPARSCPKAALDPTNVTPDKGCLGPLGAKSIVCKTDAGSPVMVRSGSGAYRLLGVLSSAAACDQQVTPLYTRLSDHLTWILLNIRSDCLCF